MYVGQSTLILSPNFQRRHVNIPFSIYLTNVIIFFPSTVCVYMKYYMHDVQFSLYVLDSLSNEFQTYQTKKYGHWHGCFSLVLIVHSYWYSNGISILLGLGMPLILPLLCAISPLSSQGVKTHICDMANSAAISKFHNNCVRTR